MLTRSKNPTKSTPSFNVGVAPATADIFESGINIPIWLIVAGCMLMFVPLIYFVYDKYCKDEGGGPMIKNVANFLVIFYLLCGLVWAVVGFVWVFGSREHQTCGADSFTYQFAFATLITSNCIMDFWICFKICVVLYWAFLSED
jgi:heme/copper-type cytochrome/quinol oxidase subunit 4